MSSLSSKSLIDKIQDANSASLCTLLSVRDMLLDELPFRRRTGDLHPVGQVFKVR